MRLGVAALLLLCIGLCPRTGLAQAASGSSQVDGSNDAAIAEATFEEGREALRRGDNERGCALLEASNRLEPALGTSLTLAHCYEKLGRSASAWVLFLEVDAWARRVNDAERAQIARVRANALEPKLTRATFEFSVPPGADQGRPSKVFVDGGEVDSAAWDIAFPIDPGSHVITATAPGHEAWEQRMEIAPSRRTFVIAVPALMPVKVSEEAPPAPLPRPQVNIDPKQGATSNDSTWPWVVGGASVVALGTGGVLAALAKRNYDESLEHCRTPTACSERGIELRDDAYAQADWATGAVAAGAVFGAVATYLWLTGGDSSDSESGDGAASDRPNSASIGVHVAPNDASVHWRGTF